MDAAESKLDLRGLTCPVPLMRTRRYLHALSAGQRVLVVTTDPDSRADFVAFCDGRTSRLITVEEHDGQLWFLIEKS